MINLFRNFRRRLGTQDIQNWFKNISADTTFNRVLQKISIIKAENGSCVAEMKIEKEHVNSKGGLHGGLTVTIVDVLTSYALLTRDSRPSVSVDIHVSYECTFYLNGHVNKHNCRYWSDDNPHLIREDNTQYPEKVNVWAGILGDCIIGPLFINQNNDELYYQMKQYSLL